MNEAMNQDDEKRRKQAKKAFNNHLTFLAAQDFEKWIDVWSETAVYEFPYMTGLFPTKLNGKKAIYEAIKGNLENVKFDRWSNVQFYPTLDPDTLVVEFRCEGKALKTGRLYNQDYVGIVRVKNGKLEWFREYMNPMILMKAFGVADSTNVDVSAAQRLTGE